MRRVVATTVLAVLVTACGMATFGTPALAPEVVTRAQPASIPVHQSVADPLAKIVPLQAAAPLAPAESAVIATATGLSADVGPMKHIWQTLNNCGPASVVMALSTFGIDADQETARLALRGTDVRRGMGPQGVDPWVSQLYGLRSMWRNNGTADLIKSLVSNGFAPMVTQWMVDPEIERIAHWRTVAGYDDAKSVFYVNDPMRGNHFPLTYSWFDGNWQPFSYRYLVIYRPEDEGLLRAIVGDEWNDRTNRQRFFERTRQEALERNDSASWLAYGEAAYTNGMFAEAVAAFDKGLSLGSAQGVFTLRSSYPQALRALGREQEAQATQQRLAGLSSVPSSTVASPPDSLALIIAIERMPIDGVRLSAE